jgi:RNA polymerase-binding transcription factor DksA
MDEEQREHLEERLIEERAKVLEQLDHYDESFDDTPQGSDGDLSAHSFHMADQGTDAMEREKAFHFASEEGRRLERLNEALRRLYEAPDQFGVCRECGEEITFERLDAVPEARVCVRCKRDEESGVGR